MIYKKIIHPFDLIKISDDWMPSLQKAMSDPEPRWAGEKHPTKPWVGGIYNHPGSENHGRLVWTANEVLSKEHDDKLRSYIDSSDAISQHPEDRELFKNFIQSILNDPNRHVRKSFDDSNYPRARHIINHFESDKKAGRMASLGGNEYKPIPGDSQLAFVNANPKAGRSLLFQTVRHKDEPGKLKSETTKRIDHFMYSERKAREGERARNAGSVYIKHHEDAPEMSKMPEFTGKVKFNEPPSIKVAKPKI